MHENSVREAIKYSCDLSEWGADFWPKKFVDFKFDRFVVASYSIANAHRQSILHLLMLDQRTSAFALFRPVLEASITAEWFRLIANEELMNFALSVGALPTTDKMVRALNKLDVDKSTIFGEMKIWLWESSSDFTHGGLRQISNWIKDGEVGSIHADDELCEMLHLMDFIFITMLFNFQKIACFSVDELIIKQHEVMIRYKNSKFVDKTSGGFVRFRGRSDLL